MQNKKFLGKLFIAGGGHTEDSVLLDLEFVKSLNSGRILYIPVGLQRDLIGYEECYDWITKTLTPYGRKLGKKLDIEMWINLAKKSIFELEKFEALYIGGARNSYSLMKEFHETKFVNLLYKFLNEGRVIYGGSTGAIILGKYISVLDEPPMDGFQKDLGLGLLGHYSVFCHYERVPMERLNKFLEMRKSPVIALTEKSGLIVSGESACVVGFQGAFLFKRNSSLHWKSIEPNESFSITKI